MLVVCGSILGGIHSVDCSSPWGPHRDGWVSSQGGRWCKFFGPRSKVSTKRCHICDAPLIFLMLLNSLFTFGLVSVIDLTCRSPLMIAAGNGQIGMLRLLLRYNADIALKDTKGWSADDYAVMNGHHPWVVLLFCALTFLDWHVLTNLCISGVWAEQRTESILNNQTPHNFFFLLKKYCFGSLLYSLAFSACIFSQNICTPEIPEASLWHLKCLDSLAVVPSWSLSTVPRGTMGNLYHSKVQAKRRKKPCWAVLPKMLKQASLWEDRPLIKMVRI